MIIIWIGRVKLILNFVILKPYKLVFKSCLRIHFAIFKKANWNVNTKSSYQSFDTVIC